MTVLHINGLDSHHPNIAPIYGLLDDDVVKTGWPLKQFATRRWPTADTHVLHVHWVDHIANRASVVSGIRQAVQLLGYLLLVRLRGGRIVWTMHNASAHEVRHERLERLVQLAVVTLANVVHVPNAATLDVIDHRWTRRVRDRSVFLPLPDPAASMPRVSREAGRRELGIDPSAMLILAFGLVRGYKGFECLVEALAECPNENLRLLIAGDGRDPSIVLRLKQLADADSRVLLRFGHQSDADVSDLFASADWIALPYRSGDNSGVMTMALSFGVPLIVTDLPGLTIPLEVEPDSRIVAKRADGVEGLRTAILQASQQSSDDLRRASIATRRLSEMENDGLRSAYRQMYEGASAR